jgi:hypothetical protein
MLKNYLPRKRIHDALEGILSGPILPYYYNLEQEIQFNGSTGGRKGSVTTPGPLVEG